MRRVLLSVLAAAVALTGFALASSSSTAGAEGIVDLGAYTVAKVAGPVSPPGASAFYTATFTNEGAIAVEGTYTNTTSGGTVVGVTAPGCSTSGNTVTCALTLQPGASKVIDVVVQTPTTLPATITNTSTATLNPGLVSFIDLYPTNNSQTVSNPVREANTLGSAGFVPEGGSLAYKKHLLTVLDAELGVIAYLSDTPAAPTLSCGGQPCKQGLRVEFTEGGEGERFYGLVKVEVNFGATDPCRGLGTPSGCAQLYYFKPGLPSPQLLPACTTGGSMPCQAGVTKVGTEFIVDVRLDTDDPDLLTPIKNLTSGAAAG